MYSLVLMTAMASSTTTADFHGAFRDRLFGSGCAGSCAGCSGNANYTSCSGCNGCSCQGGLFSGDRWRSFWSFNGSCNGCTGSNYSCSGCSGSQALSVGCCGGSVMYSCGGGMMEMGSPYATPMPVTYYGCGAVPMMGAPMTGAPMMTDPMMGTPMIPPTSLPMNGATPYAQPAPAEVREYSPTNQLPLPGGAAASPNRATVIVKLPADAKLFAESKELSLTGMERSFVTPELPQGREYNYTFRVEYDRNGRTVSESRTLAVTPGKVSTLDFNDLANKSEATPIPKVMPENKATTTSQVKTDVAGERARISVKVPAGGTLFVNDTKQANNEFRTPPLSGGKEYSYVMKVEMTLNGMAETVSQKVTIRGGDSITVDFTNAIASR
jgi:uncharacterized protein (TIGR03000 family)